MHSQIHFLTSLSVKGHRSVLSNFEGIPYMAMPDYAVDAPPRTNVTIAVPDFFATTTKVKEII